MLDEISTRIFADGADLDGILALVADPRIEGFTTNPTLMRKAGLTDYAEFARRLLTHVTQHPISFEVFADDRRRDAASGASHRFLGGERVCQDSGHDNQGRVHGLAGSRAL